MINDGSTRTFSDDLASSFAELGIRDAFLVTGGAIAPFTSSLASHGKIRMHYMLTEQSAGIAAEAYGYLDGKPALLIVTSGPGVTNALTPVAAAWTNSSPVIVISGQARSADVELASMTNSRQIGNQHVRTDQIVKSVVKAFVELDSAVATMSLASYLYMQTTNGRPGPVWLSIPQDIQRAISASVDFDESATSQPKFDSGLFKSRVLDGLSKSKAPALLLGAGARSEIDSITKFAERFRLPILTTWPGMDLIEDKHPLYCGRPGSIPSTWAPNFVNQEADFLIILGCRLDLGQVGYNPQSFAPNASVLRVDIDSQEFLRIPPRENWVNFCAQIQQIVPVLLEVSNSGIEFNNSLDCWWTSIGDWIQKYPKPISIPQEFDDGISSYRLINQISRRFTEIPIVTGSSGTCMEILLQSWEVQKGQRVINSCGIGSMGFAIPAAIGVAVKTKAEEVLCIESDGSFAMNMQDLTTMKAMKKVFKIVIMDSSGYKSIFLSQRRLQQESHGNSLGTDLHLPDIEKIASAIGFLTKTITSNEQIGAALDWLKSSPDSSILIAKVSQDEEALPRLVSKPNSAGVMITPPMNDLYPRA
ncbi:IlvB Thiamine pyrophosphate-requiring enzymes [acetolactate synthase, pyruvate dehydrogenase (cytochrome), glyoxylate carboligase, phosphonopyruvate decarboxylase] [Candidatus Nanopelagicaceae bacterium]